jgi:hypothetical protein
MEATGGQATGGRLAMIRTGIALLVIAQATMGTAVAGTCSGVALSLTNTGVKTVSTQGNLNTYTLTGTVINIGSQGQPSNTLQFVDVMSVGQKLNDRGIPPLAPGQSYTFTYDSQRATQAGKGTSTIVFRLTSPAPASCSAAQQSASITF